MNKSTSHLFSAVREMRGPVYPPKQKDPYHGSVFGQYGRIVRVGQLWRHNDLRRLRVVKIVALHHATQVAHVENVMTQKRSTIPFLDFTIGREGWSLEKEA